MRETVSETGGHFSLFRMKFVTLDLDFVDRINLAVPLTCVQASAVDKPVGRLFAEI